VKKDTAPGWERRQELAKARKAREAIEPVQRKSRREHRGEGEKADWSAADGNAIRRTINAVSAKGCAIRFGYTRDGGAFAIGVIGDGDPYTEFVRPAEDIDLYLTGLALDFEDEGSS